MIRLELTFQKAMIGYMRLQGVESAGDPAHRLNKQGATEPSGQCQSLRLVNRKVQNARTKRAPAPDRSNLSALTLPCAHNGGPGKHVSDSSGCQDGESTEEEKKAIFGNIACSVS